MQARADLNRRIWQIAWPAILSNLSVPLLGLVDTAILGHLESTVYLGAVAIGASILSFMYWGFGFLRMGTTGLVALAVGAGDRERQLVIIGQSLMLALALAALVILSHPLWAGLGVMWMGPGPELAPKTGSYIAIRVWSAPAVLVTYGVVGWFIGHQNTRWPMVFVIITNLLNIGLDFLFIVGLDMKSEGAALATVVAEYVGCALALWALSRSVNLADLLPLRSQITRPKAYQEMLNSNRHLFVRTICLLFAFAFFTAMSTGLGQDTLAANTIMLQLLMLAAYGLDGFAFAVEGLTGNAAGARKRDEFERAVAACWRWSLTTAAGICVVFGLGGPLIYPLFTIHEPVLALLREYHFWLVMMPMVAVWSYLLDGVFIGTAKTRHMMYAMLVSLLLVYLPAWYLLRGWGNHGLWLAFIIFNGARGLTLQWCYRLITRRGGWC